MLAVCVSLVGTSFSVCTCQIIEQRMLHILCVEASVEARFEIEMRTYVSVK